MAVMGGEWRLCYDVGELGVFDALDSGKKRFETNFAFLGGFDGWFETSGIVYGGGLK
ncbi:hypothetical protein [Desulfosarcina variabilis]|uniref:hypothetical protein n=1 Tax=Desulfosarcina variabilis TaxID=2300 RepID=UPI003AFB5591